MTYAELVQLLQDYLETEESTFVSQIPTFVRQAEQRIYRSVSIPELRRNATAPVAPGSVYVPRPADFIAPRSFAVIDGDGNYTYLLEKDVNFLREAYPNPATQGRPKYYAQFDGDAPTSQGNFILAPTPDAAYTLELHYDYDPPSIVDAGTSWLGENASGALLYGAMVEAYTFLKGDQDMLEQYGARYAEAMQQLFGVDIRNKRDNYRDGRA
jgi:hypothetical protein